MANVPDQSSWKRRVGTWGIGHTANLLISKGGDFVLYPLAIWFFGLLYGAAIMWLISLILCYFTFLFYDWCKVDWLGIETLKAVREAEEKGGFHRVIKWLLNRGDAIALVALSVKWDPFIAVVYLRRGAHQYRMTKRDWKLFGISFLLANIWWTTVVFSGLTVLEWLIEVFKSAF